MIVTGRLIEVVEEFEGSSVKGDVAAGATVIPLADLGDFAEDGLCSIADAPYTFVVDEEAGTLVVDPPLAADAGDGTPVYALTWDSQRQSERVAVVDLLDGQAGVARAEVPVGLRPMYPVGPSLAGALVDLDTIEGGYVVANSPMRELFFDGSYIDPVTLPPSEAPPANPPSVSPPVTLTGIPGGIIARAETVSASTLIEYHVSTVEGFVPVQGDPATLFSIPTRSAVQIIDRLPNGSPLVENTSYYVATWATNAAGNAPAPSATVMGRVDMSAVRSVAVAEVVSGFVMSGRIEVGSGSWDANEGLVFRDANGNPFITLPVDGSTAAEIRGYFVAKGLTVENNANFYGLAQMFGTLRMPSGISDPAIPATMSRTWASVTATAIANDTVVAPSTVRGLVPAIHDASQMVVARSFVGGGGLRSFNSTTGGNDPFFFPNIADGKFAPDGGITRIGSNYYVLGTDSNRSGAWYVYKLDSNGAKVSEWAWVASPTTRPAIGNDGTYILISWSTTTNVIRSNSYDPATGALLGTVDLTHNLGAMFDLGGTYFGLADFAAGGGWRNVVAPRNRDPLVFNNVGVRQPGEEFLRAGGSDVHGLLWDGTRFRHVDNQGRAWSYETGNPVGSTVHGGYTWYDGDTSSGSIAHETKVSPAQSFVWPARSRLVVSGQPAPDAAVTDPALRDKANLVRIYAGPTPTMMRLQSGGGANGALPLGVTQLAVAPLDTGSIIAPTSSGFATTSSAAGSIQAATRGFMVNGNSDGSVGTGTFRDSVAQVAEATQVASTATVNPTSTANVTIPGLSLPITSPGPTVKYEVRLEPDVQITVAPTANIVELMLDGVAQSGCQVVTQGPVGTRPSGSRTWLITGLAAGAHTFTAQTRNTGASTGASVYAGTTTLAVKRVG